MNKSNLPSPLWVLIGPSPIVAALAITLTMAFSSGSTFGATNQIPTNMVWIPPGTFLMGSPEEEQGRLPDENRHEVTLTQGFWMGKFEVTQQEYLEVVGGNNPSYYNGIRNYPAPGTDYGNNLLRPVEWVTWYQAQNYCFMRTAKERSEGKLDAQSAYRLPTEAEWEYACRAGSRTAFHYGPGLRSGMANFDGRFEYDAEAGTSTNPYGVYLDQTTPVGGYEPNAFGLYDMHGNVWEWVQDYYDSYPNTPVTDPTGPSSGGSRIFRGGSHANGVDFIGGAVWCRSSIRVPMAPSMRFSDLGFRVVLTAPAPPGLLSISRSSEGIMLSWMATGVSYLLEKANQPTGPWQIHGAYPYEETISHEIPMPMTEQRQFFRLRNYRPLMIEQQPASVDVVMGHSAQFTVQAAGEGVLRYQWYFNAIPINGATNAQLTIDNVDASDEGHYSVDVSDDLGMVISEDAGLRLLVRPTIVQHPQGQSITVGETGTFTVAVTNRATLPITYRWRKGNITVATDTLNAHQSTYTIPNAQAGDAGRYTVVVTNPAFTAPGFLSQGAVLEVNP